MLDVLAQNYFGNTRQGSLTGPVGALIIAAMIVATVFLIRNMNARLRRLPETFDEGGHSGEAAAQSEPAADPTDRT